MRSKIAKIGIIGGSGVEELLFTGGFKKKTVRTKYGDILVKHGKIDGRSVVFLNRHGWEYTAPSQINYRANMAALKKEEIQSIVATAAVGSLSDKLRPGSFVILDDFIDFTEHRSKVFSDHSFLDMCTPYSAFLMEAVKKAAEELRINIKVGATYVCTEGPRFETKAEIRMFRKLGAEVVGMTQVPEVVLAAEVGIPYAAIGVVTNYAAGITSRRVSAHEVLVMMKDKSKVLSKLILQTIKSL